MDQELKAYLDEKFRRIDEKLEQVDRLEAQFVGLSARVDKLDAQADQLRVYLSEEFRKVENRFVQVEQQAIAMEARLIHLISEHSESLQREIAAVADNVIDMKRRLDRQAGLIQTGARFSARMADWSERVDIALEDAKNRIQFLELKKPPQ